jgi:hypothetical protein
VPAGNARIPALDILPERQHFTIRQTFAARPPLGEGYEGGFRRVPI